MRHDDGENPPTLQPGQPSPTESTVPRSTNAPAISIRGGTANVQLVRSLVTGNGSWLNVHDGGGLSLTRATSDPLAGVVPVAPPVVLPPGIANISATASTLVGAALTEPGAVSAGTITNVVVTATNVVVTFKPANPAATYRLARSTNLVAWNVLTDAPQVVADTLVFTATRSAIPVEFFRVVQQ